MKTMTNSRATKAVLASGVAILLLAGAGGTFARWFDEEAAQVDPLNSGLLSLNTPTVTSFTEATLGDLTGLTDYEMVPGDVVTTVLEVTPTIVGDNMIASFTAVPSADSGGLAQWVTVETTVLGAADDLTEAESGTPVQVEVVVTFPFATGGELGAGNGLDGQDLTLEAKDIALSLVQDER